MQSSNFLVAGSLLFLVAAAVMLAIPTARRGASVLEEVRYVPPRCSQLCRFPPHMCSLSLVPTLPLLYCPPPSKPLLLWPLNRSPFESQWRLGMPWEQYEFQPVGTFPVPVRLDRSTLLPALLDAIPSPQTHKTSPPMPHSPSPSPNPNIHDERRIPDTSTTTDASLMTRCMKRTRRGTRAQIASTTHSRSSLRASSAPPSSLGHIL
jgi:hypothetical protein